MSDARTIAVYDARVDDYAALGGDAPDRHLRVFLDALPPGGKVLDLGCGPGNAAVLMQAAGFVVAGLDASEGFVAAARARGIDASHGTFDDVTEVAALDGVWANFSLLHAPKADLPRHLSAIARALKPGGILHVGVKTGTGEGRDGLGRFYAYYTEAELEAHLRAAGFAILSRDTGESVGLDGVVAPWLILVARLA